MSQLRARLACALLLLLSITGLALPNQDGGRKVKSKVDPAYPELAKSMRLSGVVRVEVTITPGGSVRDMKVVGGNPVLANSALAALKQWKFEPASDETTQLMEFRFNVQ